MKTRLFARTGGSPFLFHPRISVRGASPWDVLRGLFLSALLAVSPVRAVETDCIVHDPSTIVKCGSAYWLFGTGTGCPSFSSLDRLHWKPGPPVFVTAPGWVAAAVPGNTGNHIWAPDVRRIGRRYCLYYSVSTFGSNTSAIGLATSDSLAHPAWVDRGIVLRSRPGDDFNAIDPCVVGDAQSGLWLSFGSFWSGIKMVRLDPATGMLAARDRTVYTLASHSQDPANSIEASCVCRHGGYYYLLVNWGYCCRGRQSTYEMRLGRSRVVTGPYRDRNGRDMRQGGGSLFLSAGAPEAAQIGPGHAGVLSDNDGDWLSCHYEWARDHNGAPTLNLGKLTWGKDGWPSLHSGTQNGPPSRTGEGRVTGGEGLKRAPACCGVAYAPDSPAGPPRRCPGPLPKSAPAWRRVP